MEFTRSCTKDTDYTAYFGVHSLKAKAYDTDAANANAPVDAIPYLMACSA